MGKGEMSELGVGGKKELWSVLTQARTRLKLPGFYHQALARAMKMMARKGRVPRGGSLQFTSYLFAQPDSDRERASVLRPASSGSHSPMKLR
jgi:hypothetical protein